MNLAKQKALTNCPVCVYTLNQPLEIDNYEYTVFESFAAAICSKASFFSLF